MNVSRLGERGLIEEIRRRFGDAAPPPPRGIGDDAAVLRPGRGSLLLTTDCLIEGRHFRRREPARLLGRKALAVNLSDIAAMGGTPDSFLLTLGIPSDLTSRYLDDLLDGMISSAREHRVDLIGGDTSSSPGPLVISITLFGRVPSGKALTRSGARPGDSICVSGALGGSAAGRLLLDSGRPKGLRAVRAEQAISAHLDPAPRLSLGRELLAKRIASACIDISDGLSIDLARLAEASRVGARLLAPAIPIADSTRAVAPLLKRDPLDLALHGGEDYELLFTVPPAKERYLSEIEALTIGRITPASKGLSLADARGRDHPLRIAGFDHFKDPASPRR